MFSAFIHACGFPPNSHTHLPHPGSLEKQNILGLLIVEHNGITVSVSTNSAFKWVLQTLPLNHIVLCGLLWSSQTLRFFLSFSHMVREPVPDPHCAWLLFPSLFFFCTFQLFLMLYVLIIWQLFMPSWILILSRVKIMNMVSLLSQKINYFCLYIKSLKSIATSETQQDRGKKLSKPNQTKTKQRITVTDRNARVKGLTLSYSSSFLLIFPYIWIEFIYPQKVVELPTLSGIYF